MIKQIMCGELIWVHRSDLQPTGKVNEKSRLKQYTYCETVLSGSHCGEFYTVTCWEKY